MCGPLVQVRAGVVFASSSRPPDDVGAVVRSPDPDFNDSQIHLRGRGKGHLLGLRKQIRAELCEEPGRAGPTHLLLKEHVKGQNGEEAEVGRHRPPVGFLWRRTRPKNLTASAAPRQTGGPARAFTPGSRSHTTLMSRGGATPSRTQGATFPPPSSTHLCLLQPSVHLPEVFGEELFPDGLTVDPNPLPDLDQMRGTTRQDQSAWIKGTVITCTPLVGGGLASAAFQACYGGFW